jgi:glycine/D-amino acid oxidase-like deaminating enzyme
MARFEHWRVEERWQGIYPSHPNEPIFRQNVGERVHIITGIGGKGMTTGPAVARESIDAIIQAEAPAIR